LQTIGRREKSFEARGSVTEICQSETADIPSFINTSTKRFTPKGSTISGLILADSRCQMENHRKVFGWLFNYLTWRFLVR